ncbi:unnamed protein product [Ostreobium quekettii]|uniref:Uncharacterized protein n=1 Tax=Ostreobium quekettii TaxID=121088 RepID=A0A8S1IUA9_9CHLO|nr:unnamed protein product [Ostreobium quekettii]
MWCRRSKTSCEVTCSATQFRLTGAATNPCPDMYPPWSESVSFQFHEPVRLKKIVPFTDTFPPHSPVNDATVSCCGQSNVCAGATSSATTQSILVIRIVAHDPLAENVMFTMPDAMPF